MSIEQKSKYVAPSTRRVTVELEQGFMNASVVNKDVMDDSKITIDNQEVGAESDYFKDSSRWDY